MDSLEGECRELRTCLQVGARPAPDEDVDDVDVTVWKSSVRSFDHI